MEKNEQLVSQSNKEAVAQQAQPVEAPATVLGGLSDEQRVQLRKKLDDLARGIGGATPIVATASYPHPSHTNVW